MYFNSKHSWSSKDGSNPTPYQNSKQYNDIIVNFQIEFCDLNEDFLGPIKTMLHVNRGKNIHCCKNTIVWLHLNLCLLWNALHFQRRQLVYLRTWEQINIFLKTNSHIRERGRGRILWYYPLLKSRCVTIIFVFPFVLAKFFFHACCAFLAHCINHCLQLVRFSCGSVKNITDCSKFTWYNSNYELNRV